MAAGVIRTDRTLERAFRLAELQRELRALIAELRPDVVAVERVLFQRNVSTAMGVAMASGLAMAEAASAGCDVVEYSPNEVKQSVAGWGGAGKDEVAAMVQTLMSLPERLSPVDAADAMAVAMCHAARVPLTQRNPPDQSVDRSSGRDYPAGQRQRNPPDQSVNR